MGMTFLCKAVQCWLILVLSHVLLLYFRARSSSETWVTIFVFDVMMFNSLLFTACTLSWIQMWTPFRGSSSMRCDVVMRWRGSFVTLATSLKRLTLRCAPQPQWRHRTHRVSFGNHWWQSWQVKGLWGCYDSSRVNSLSLFFLVRIKHWSLYYQIGLHRSDKSYIPIFDLKSNVFLHTLCPPGIKQTWSDIIVLCFPLNISNSFRLLFYSLCLWPSCSHLF